jgi:hypothetical protein
MYRGAPLVDILDHTANLELRAALTKTLKPCPSSICDGFLSEYEQVSMDPFKAFLFCPECESRLRVHKVTGDWQPRERIIIP